MSECPQYRLRLFLTVDLVGSTAFKANARQDPSEPHPEWVKRFRQFYQQFPETLESCFRDTETGRTEQKSNYSPKVWKTIGDEILFCCRVTSLQHLSCCVSAFLKALDTFGRNLDADRLPLDVKGSGWVAAFPAENISIEVMTGTLSATGEGEDYITEKFELEADSSPSKFDFLGKAIDAGFRIAKNASADRFTASAELACLLAEASKDHLFNGRFSYHGKEVFKGVNGGRSYPVVSVDAERNSSKRTLRTRERMLTQEAETPALALYDYLVAFMEDQSIEAPFLPGSTFASVEPSSYLAFKEAWLNTVTETTKRDVAVDQSEESDNQSGEEHLAPTVTEFAEAMMSAKKSIQAVAEFLEESRKRR